MDRVQATGKVRKRKAENQDNERLSKRLSLLNLERNGQKLYVPVEQPSLTTATNTPAGPKISSQTPEDDVMQLDDTKHKVYIYDLDAELSDSESSDDGKLVFLPDIQKHLLDTRIPASILANSEGELAGHNQQLVLYNVPSSLTVPEEKDSVRKAIIETRARARAKQDQKREAGFRQAQTPFAPIQKEMDSDGYTNGMVNDAGSSALMQQEEPMEVDPDAMDLG